MIRRSRLSSSIFTLTLPGPANRSPSRKANKMNTQRRLSALAKVLLLQVTVVGKLG
jgi:hypothetical protein